MFFFPSAHFSSALRALYYFLFTFINGDNATDHEASGYSVPVTRSTQLLLAPIQKKKKKKNGRKKRKIKREKKRKKKKKDE